MEKSRKFPQAAEPPLSQCSPFRSEGAVGERSRKRLAPEAPFRPCKKFGCGKITKNKNGYCDTHQEYARELEEARKKRWENEQESSSQRGYGAAWRRLRAAKLRSCPLCERCGAVATVVHHKDKNQWNCSWDNLESLCRDCHEEHHGRKIKKRD